MKATKTNQVKALLNSPLQYSSKEIAEYVGCDVTLVNQIKRELAKPKRGRPRKVDTVITPSVSLIDASRTMLDLTKRLKNVSIAFDHDNDRVDVMWFDEAYYVEVGELPKFIESMEYIASKEYKYLEMDNGNA